MDPHRQKTSVALLSVFSNTCLVLLKVVVGLVTGSVSVISEAAHSAVDLLASIIAFAAVRTSGRPADTQHPFGHGKVENISGAVEALLIFLAAGWIIYEAVRKLLHPHPLVSPGWGVAVMLVSVVVNIVVSHMLFRVGNRTHSVALQADAWHLRTDVYTSAGVMAALGVITVGHGYFAGVNLLWVDSLAALVVAVLILKAAYDLTAQSLRDLLDASLPAEEEQRITRMVNEMRPAVCGSHKLRTRRSGPTRFIELHLLVHPDMSVKDSHSIADDVVARIKSEFPDSRVLLHVEPYDGSSGIPLDPARPPDGKLASPGE